MTGKCGRRDAIEIGGGQARPGRGAGLAEDARHGAAHGPHPFEVFARFDRHAPIVAAMRTA
jgi:hypothetical protein